MSSAFLIPRKLPAYCQRLEIEYENETDGIFLEIIRSSRISVREAVDYDNLNGGTTGHDLIFYVPRETISKLRLGTQKEITNKLAEDLNFCSKSVPDEWIRAVHIELFSESDPECLAAVEPFGRTFVAPDTLPYWKPGQIRLFISHRDTYKYEAKRLASALEGFGISSFVAHDTIEPMERWQVEILKALRSMEIMLTFITDDFFESFWANQEIGFALGVGTPIIRLKLQSTDPQGFIGDIQALRGNVVTPEESANDIYKLLVTKLGKGARVRQSVLSAFVESPNFLETQERFKRLEAIDTMTEDEIQVIIDAYDQNDQLHNCFYLDNDKNHRLAELLKRHTGFTYQIKGRTIISDRGDAVDEAPF